MAEMEKLDRLNSLSHDTIGAAISVHRELGPGLLEEDYQQALALELAGSGIRFQCQHPMPVVYKDVRLDAGYRIDLLVENSLVVELKSVELIHPVQMNVCVTNYRFAK